MLSYSNKILISPTNFLKFRLPIFFFYRSSKIILVSPTDFLKSSCWYSFFQQIVCERSCVFASACAAARAYPLFSRRLGSKGSSARVVTIEFILVGENSSKPLTDGDIQTLAVTADAVRQSARIVDTPCNEMNTDHFLQVPKSITLSLNSQSDLCSPQIIRMESSQSL